MYSHVQVFPPLQVGLVLVVRLLFIIMVKFASKENHDKTIYEFNLKISKDINLCSKIASSTLTFFI